MIYVTGNKKKFEEATISLAPLDLEQVDLDFPEIQGSSKEVLTDKALKAWEKLRKPFIIEDVSFEADALGGMPGPYIKDFLFALADHQITLFDILSPLGNTKAKAHCHVAYVKSEKDILFITGSASGTVVPPKGNLDHGKVSFNKVFKPDNFHKTYGEMTMEEHAVYSSRGNALEKLKAHPRFLKDVG